jgi:general secretion pathway protein H
MPRPARNARRAAGYTLLELLVTLAILAGIMSVAYASWHGRRSDERLDIVADKLRLALIETRTAASREAMPKSLFVDLDKREWRTVTGEVERIPDGADVTVTSARQGASDAPLRQAEFRFTPEGSSSGGTIKLVEGGETILVTVDWLTGRVGLVTTDD